PGGDGGPTVAGTDEAQASHELARSAMRRAQALAAALGADCASAAEILAGPRGEAAVALDRLDTAYQRCQALRDISAKLHNYEGGDLRRAGLRQVASLDGIRWTASTRWPDAWTAEIERRSVDLGGGIREIREGTGVSQPA